MKRKFLAPTFIILTFGVSSLVQAQTTNTPDRNATPESGLRARPISPTATKRLGERREAANTARGQLRGLWHERTGNFLELAARRLNAARERLTNLLARAESRIEQLVTEQPTTDLSEVRDALAVAKSKLAAAKESLDRFQGERENLQQTIADNLEAKTPQPFAPLRAALEDAKQALQAAHNALRDLLVAIKTAINQN